MDINQVREQLTDFRNKVSQMISVEEMIVFGSYAQETASKTSDIDVMIISTDFKRLRSDKRLKILDEAAAFIRPEIVAAGFTREELNQASLLSLLGQAREGGIRFQ
jgi:predicted nucleotidyltransferase